MVSKYLTLFFFIITDLKIYKSLLFIFPDVSLAIAPIVIDQAQKRMKHAFVAKVTN